MTKFATRWDGLGQGRRYPEAGAQTVVRPAMKEPVTFRRTSRNARTTHARLRQHGRDHARCRAAAPESFDDRPMDARTDSPSPCDVHTVDELGPCRLFAWGEFRGVTAAASFAPGGFPRVWQSPIPGWFRPLTPMCTCRRGNCKQRLSCSRQQPGRFPDIRCSVRWVRGNGVNSIASTAPTTWGSRFRCPLRLVPRRSTTPRERAPNE